ncbi:MAG: VOC family protein [Gemmatimonadetes bacterium]|nr:VOC family protein [Gemmatimonadota bacterium]
MPLRDSYPTSTFCWIQHSTHQCESARQYYGALFGWSFDAEGRATLKDRLIAAIGDSVSDQHLPPHWLGYVSVADVEQSTYKGERLGATVLREPVQAGSWGRLAVLRDPQGAHFAMWEPHASHGAEIVNEHGTLCWNELLTREPDAAGSFYSTLFDWTIEPYGDSYTVFMNGERPAGGLMSLGEDAGGAPSSWLVYFMVDDCDAIHDHSNTLGGSVQMPPDDWPEVGRGSVLIDPQGASFGAMHLLDPPD